MKVYETLYRYLPLNVVLISIFLLSVPVIHVSSTSNKEVCSVEYVKLPEDEIGKYSDGVVTLIDGSQWFKIPLSEGRYAFCL